MPLYFDKKQMGKPKISPEEKFPELFAVNRKIDRRQCARVVPMRVLVLGMCRTGTHCTLQTMSLTKQWPYVGG